MNRQKEWCENTAKEMLWVIECNTTTWIEDGEAFQHKKDFSN